MIGRRIVAITLTCVVILALTVGATAWYPDPSNEDIGAYGSLSRWWPYLGHFNYTDGKAKGTYVSFIVDEATGAVTEYSFSVIYPTLTPNTEHCSGDGETLEKTFSEYNLTRENVTVFESITVDGFIPVTPPNTFADFFVFQGENTLIIFYDREGVQGCYASGDVKKNISFVVADGFKISKFPENQGLPDTADLDETQPPLSPDYNDTYWQEGWHEDWYEEDTSLPPDVEDLLGQPNLSHGWFDTYGYENTTIPLCSLDENNGLNEWPFSTNYNDTYWQEDVVSHFDDNQGYTDGFNWMFPWTEIWVEDSYTMTTISVYNGNATLVDNLIIVSLNPNGYLEIASWPQMPFFSILDDIWYDDPVFEDEMKIIEKAKANGVIAGEGWYLEGDLKITQNITNFCFYGDPTFNMEFTYVNDRSVDVVVDSKIPDGRIVMIDLDNAAFETRSIDDLVVKLDRDQIERVDSLEDLVAQVGGTEAGYHALYSDLGITVFVYVPHFSAHTITIESVLSRVPNLLAPSLMVVVFVVITTVGILVRGRSTEGEY